MAPGKKAHTTNPKERRGRKSLPADQWVVTVQVDAPGKPGINIKQLNDILERISGYIEAHPHDFPDSLNKNQAG